MAADQIKVLLAGDDGVVIYEFVLGEGVHAIGSAEGCAIRVETAAPEHARLQVVGGQMFIEDLAVPNAGGVWLDGAAVLGKLQIYSGQIVQVADRWLALRVPTDVRAGQNDLLAGRYRLQRQLGRGGRGEVWLALDEQINEKIAIKRLPEELAGDATALNDLLREVQKSRHLNHRNIIRIHDLVQPTGEPPFVTLELVEGQDLALLRFKQPGHLFAWDALQPLMTQLCDALEYAHASRIVHRDLKPANMLIDQLGTLKLADFGIAATMAESLSRSSMQGNISGTSVYMSPQQMRGELPRASDDIYALGSTFYELLTSRTPFYSGDIAYQVMNEDPKPLGERLAELGLQNQVPDNVCALIMVCLSKDPAQRPARASDVLTWISDLPPQVNQPTSNEPTQPPIIAAPTAGGLPVPETLGQPASKEPPPPVDDHRTVQKRVADAKWASIQVRDNPWHRVLNIGAGIFVLLVLLSTAKSDLKGSLFCVAVTMLMMVGVNRFLIKPKRYFCSECNYKLHSDKPGPCRGCGVSLT